MTHGKTITIFLMDDIPSGRMYCELSNWIGKVYKIPRMMIKDCYDRADLVKATGVYILFGKDKEDDKDKAYIGQAEDILVRLKQHLDAKVFWTEVIVFIHKDKNLNSAHIKYIESRLCGLAKTVNQYKLDNGNTPSLPNVSESDQAMLEKDIDNLKMLVRTLGHKIFEETRTQPKPIGHEKIADVIFELKARNVEAKGMPTADGFLVLKNSQISIDMVRSCSPCFVQKKQKLIEQNKVVKDGNAYVFSEDIVFNSPSTAAAVCIGRNTNGREMWKLPDGTTLKEYEEKP